MKLGAYEPTRGSAVQ